MGKRVIYDGLTEKLSQCVTCGWYMPPTHGGQKASQQHKDSFPDHLVFMTLDYEITASKKAKTNDQ